MTRIATYRHFGLTVSSDLPLPLDEDTDIGAISADVCVTQAHVSLEGRQTWRSSIGPQCAYFEGDDQHIIEWNSARFGVTPDRIRVDGEPNDITIQLLLFPVWAALLALRGREPLHGAVVERDGCGLALMGPSGHGKTTGSLLLIEQGWRLVTDDLIVLDETGRVIPGPPFMRLRRDRAAGREVDLDGAGKYRFRPPQSVAPVELSAAVVLNAKDNQVRQLSGTEGVEALLTTAFNVFPAHPKHSQNWLKTALTLARKIPIYSAPPRSLTTELLSGMLDGDTWTTFPLQESVS
jgi:hypothetical protein